MARVGGVGGLEGFAGVAERNVLRKGYGNDHLSRHVAVPDPRGDTPGREPESSSPVYARSGPAAPTEAHCEGTMASGELPEGTVTILFTDVEGSTDLRMAKGDEAAQEILRAHESLVRQVLMEHGGPRKYAVTCGVDWSGRESNSRSQLGKLIETRSGPAPAGKGAGQAVSNLTAMRSWNPSWATRCGPFVARCAGLPPAPR